jgi:hypothetical protein
MSPNFASQNNAQPQEELAAKLEGGKITLPEIIFFGSWAFLADAAEILGAFVLAVPLIGIVLWIMMAAFGLFSSAVIAIWLFSRGASYGIARRAIRKVIIYLGGSAADALTGGMLPLRTVSLLLAIWIHNHPKLSSIAGQAASGIKNPV